MKPTKKKTLSPAQVKAENDALTYQFEQASQQVCDLARSGNKYALRKLARVAVELTECMNELLATDATAHKTAVECWRPIFALVPAMPVMKHRHGGDMQAIQERLDLLKVGSKLTYNTSKDAKFKPHTPINAYLTCCLVHLHQVRAYIHARLKSKQDKTPDKALARCVKDERGIGWFAAEEMPIHLACYKLPLLAKTPGAWGEKQSLADKWAREALLPLIRLRESSLEDFARRMGYTVRPGKIDSDVLNKVAQALEILAPKTLH